MHANGEFIARVRGVLYPVAGVGEQEPHRRPDLGRIDSDISFCGPVAARPSPDAAEHPSMESFDEAFIQHLARQPTEDPGFGLEDASLLDLIELSPESDVARDQRLALFGRERSGAVGFV